jgi:hypothetical protein
MIHFLASEPHYQEHLKPVYEALSPAIRGTFTHKASDIPRNQLCVVASARDYKYTTGPVVFFEHGAGYTYNINHSAYAGGPGRERVILFCNTNEIVAKANRAAYPHIPNVIVGCPKLDRLINTPKPNSQVIAFSWHWDCKVAPETRTALPHYKDILQHITKDQTWIPLGHAHPRAWHMLQPLYKRLRWPVARTFNEVVDKASVYVCDTSSTIYEFAALDRPVIILNAPEYRKDVSHGLRFWDKIPGIQIDHPGDLQDAINEALTNDTWANTRKEITKEVYPHLGESARRAAEAISALV